MYARPNPELVRATPRRRGYMKQKMTLTRIGNGCGILGGTWLICLALAPIVSSQGHGYTLHIFQLRYVALVFAIVGTLLSSRRWAILAVVILAAAMIQPI